jgi:hypothetical protein
MLRDNAHHDVSMNRLIDHDRDTARAANRKYMISHPMVRDEQFA